MNPFWSEERVGELRRLVERGDSARIIAAQLGCSRNAVVGKAQRLGLRLKGVSSNPAGGGRPKAGPRRAASGDRVRVAAKARRRGVTVAAPALPTVTFLAAVEAGTCLFFACDPFAPDGPDMPVCGGARVAGSRYCALHERAKVDGAAIERRERRRELRRLAA